MEKRTKDRAGFFYLIHLREFMRLNETTYKLGRTSDVKQRLQNYPNGSRYCFCLAVADMYKFEDRVRKKFLKKFKHRKEYGREYFSGNVDSMIEEVMRIKQKHPTISVCGFLPKATAQPMFCHGHRVHIKSKEYPNHDKGFILTRLSHPSWSDRPFYLCKSANDGELLLVKESDMWPSSNTSQAKVSKAVVVEIDLEKLKLYQQNKGCFVLAQAGNDYAEEMCHVFYYAYPLRKVTRKGQDYLIYIRSDHAFEIPDDWESLDIAPIENFVQVEKVSPVKARQHVAAFCEPHNRHPGLWHGTVGDYSEDADTLPVLITATQETLMIKLRDIHVLPSNEETFISCLQSCIQAREVARATMSITR